MLAERGAARPLGQITVLAPFRVVTRILERVRRRGVKKSFRAGSRWPVGI
jgi:hypothetical protein